MKPYRITIAVPSGPVFEGEIFSFSARGLEGDFAVLADHVPFVTYVKAGECHLTDADGTVRRAESAGGLFAVEPDGVRFLPTSWEWKDTA